MLPLPPHHDPAHAARWDFAPDPTALAASAADWAREHGLRPAAADRRRVELLVIDAQRDFSFPQGTLYVGGRSGRGAVEDSERLARFVYQNLGALTGVTCTLDTHFPFQIFFPTFWEGRDGEPVAAHREVTADDVRSGALRPRRELAAWLCDGDQAWLARQAEFYCEQLERAGKYRLYLWPLHCLAGGDGHALAGVIQEARLFHAFARRAPNLLEVKGGHPLTENYSVLSPEVLLRHDGGELAQRNGPLYDRLLTADALYVAGQASSHCVRSSVDDLLDEITRRDPALASRVHVLVDCMSAVVVRDGGLGAEELRLRRSPHGTGDGLRPTTEPDGGLGAEELRLRRSPHGTGDGLRPTPEPDGAGGFVADFTPQAEEALARWEAAGMRLARSDDPVAGSPVQWRPA